MADNPYKREIANLAISILREGRTATAGQFFTSITDAQFADWSTATQSDVKQVCFHYEPALKDVILDIKPDFAVQYADLAEEIKINKEFADWGLLFELPTNFLKIVSQVDEANEETTLKSKVLTFDSYAHVVKGTDEQAWKCIVAHTAAAANKPITGASYATNWELYNTDEDYGATWVTGSSYKASESGLLLGTNNYSNTDDDSAYIKYLAYVQAGISDKPQFYPQSFKQAFAVKLALAMTKDKEKQAALLNWYERLAKPNVWKEQSQEDYEEDQTTILEARLL